MMHKWRQWAQEDRRGALGLPQLPTTPNTFNPDTPRPENGFLLWVRIAYACPTTASLCVTKRRNAIVLNYSLTSWTTASQCTTTTTQPPSQEHLEPPKTSCSFTLRCTNAYAASVAEIASTTSTTSSTSSASCLCSLYHQVSLKHAPWRSTTRQLVTTIRAFNSLNLCAAVHMRLRTCFDPHPCLLTNLVLT